MCGNPPPPFRCRLPASPCSVYVEDAEGKLVGVVSIRDVVAELLARAFDLRSSPVPAADGGSAAGSAASAP